MREVPVSAWALVGVGTASAGLAAALIPNAVVAVLVVGLAILLIFAAQSRVQRLVPVAPWTGRWAPELVALPLAVAMRQTVAITAASLAIVLVIALVRPRHSDIRFRGVTGPFVLLLMACLITARSGSASASVFVLIAGLVLWISLRKGTTQVDAMQSLVRGVALYLIANVAGWVVGIPSPVARSRYGGLDSSTELFGQRLLFPFERSINEAPIVAAAFAAILAGYIVTRRTIAWVEWVGVVAACFVLLGSNSRAPLAVGAALAAAVLVGPRLTRYVTAPIALIALLLPFYLSAIRPVITSAAATLSSTPLVSRGQSSDQIVDLNNRGELWDVVVPFWQHESGGQWWFGWGENGHVASGIYQEYADVMGQFLADPAGLTAHNSLLQQLLDGGVVGAALMIGGLVWLLARLRSPLSVPWMIGVATLAAGGATEAVFAPARTALPYMLVLAVAAFAPGMSKAFAGSATSSEQVVSSDDLAHVTRVDASFRSDGAGERSGVELVAAR